ncbi:RlpA-like double-psi beta-barrel-protein domain-containing protein-containing protein [Rhexocercosporidium sp. MPI-PUGE-AT-0058]|nr:RlpA-like double-psi beta-barrel-protein domain-containing protein-containing protein [Rhexocercosporidium sp. MPI-PUGE-AT-0058]
MKATNFISSVVGAMVLLAGAAQAITGEATYYTQQGVAGSCGVYHSDNDYIVALGPAWGHNTHCGARVTIRQRNNGRSVTAIVADTCPGCPQTKLDVSVGIYAALQGFVGLDPFPIEWNFI